MMPLLHEPTTASAPIDALTELARSVSAATGTTPVRGVRRGARVRARLVHPRRRQARRNAWDIKALGLPAPLLTAPMAMDDDLPAAESSSSTEVIDSSDSGQQRAIQAIDLSDGPKVIISPDPEDGPVASAPVIGPSTPGPPSFIKPLTGSPYLHEIALRPYDLPFAALEASAGAPAVPIPATAFPAFPATPISAGAAPAVDSSAVTTPTVISSVIPGSKPGMTQIPDPIRLVTEPSRIPEALLAAVLAVVATLVAWGTVAPSQVWISLATLPVVGLLALLLPGGDSARVIRAGALLIAAAGLPVMSPSMTPVTLVVALAAVVTYPALVGPWAGRVIVFLAIGSLTGPLAIDALTDGPHALDVLIDPTGGLLIGARLTLGSGILVVALIGSFAMAARRTLSSIASMALARERTARAATARAELISGLDSSTGLPNRDALLRTVTIALTGRELGEHGPEQAVVGLLLLDLDRFTDLADRLGAAVADDVAEQVADRLRAEFPAQRALARVDRHQFAVLPAEATSDACATVARRITALMRPPIVSLGHELRVTYSMGAALSGPHLKTADDVLQAADEACRAAQGSSQAHWVMFDQTIRTNAHRRATLEIELREAVQQQSIEVAFQPVLALGSGTREDRIVGAEALARWTRPDGTEIEPMHFIPLADEIGLGTLLGMQVIQRALAALVVWRHEGVGVDQVWVNLSAGQLNDPEFAHEVAAQLAIRGLAASSLVLEISASRLPESEQALSTLVTLRSLGIAVALDDFGRNGTSFSTLRRLPISAVKLDHLMAAELGQHDAVPRSIAQLCRTLGLRVVVEGVETLRQLHGAREIGADAVQGHAIARPMSAGDVTDLLTLRLPCDFRPR